MPWAAIAQIAMTVLAMIIERKTDNAEDKELHKRLAQRLREQGLKDVRSRFEADDQLASNDAEWDRLEAEKK